MPAPKSPMERKLGQLASFFVRHGPAPCNHASIDSMEQAISLRLTPVTPPYMSEFSLPRPELARPAERDAGAFILVDLDRLSGSTIPTEHRPATSVLTVGGNICLKSVVRGSDIALPLRGRGVPWIAGNRHGKSSSALAGGLRVAMSGPSSHPRGVSAGKDTASFEDRALPPTPRAGCRRPPARGPTSAL